jgi:soluble lytic murein transglycosylase-like protein
VEIVEDIAAVRRRIAQIAGDASPADVFGAVLQQRLHSAPAFDARIARADVEALARRAGTRYGVEPALIEAIVRNESGFDAAATSPAGAQGLMQLMPTTAQSLGVTDAYDPAQNLAAGTRYLRGLLDRFKRVDLAVAAYNAGPNAVAHYGGVPPFAETKAYVRSVLAEYRRRLQAGNVQTNAGSQHDGNIVP